MSDALVRAAELEKTVNYPMVAIDPNLPIPLEAWALRFERGLVNAPLLHFRGHNIVNPFNPFWFRSAGARVARNKAAAGKAAEKYDWMIDLHEAAWEDHVLVPEDVVSELSARGIIERRAEASSPTSEH